MKKYILDRLVLMTLLLLGCILSWIIFSPIEATISSFILFVCIVIFCKRVLLIPIDIIVGKKTGCAYFSAIVGGERLLIYKNYHCDLWKFYHGSNTTFILLNRDANFNKDIFSCKTPKTNRKLNIAYWKYSGILLNWTICEEGN